MYKYSTVTVVTDNGPYITKLILEAPEEIRADALTPDVFNVYVERKNPRTGELFMASKTWMGPRIYPSKGYRAISAIYPCDDSGAKVYSSKKIACEMPYGPVYPLGYAQASFGMMNEFVRSDYRVTQIKEIPGEIPITGMVFDEFAGDICEQLKGWKNDVSHYAPLPLGYGYFTPDFEGLRAAAANPSPFRPAIKIPDKVPLVIWLHGAGEGGTDPTIAYTGNKVVALSGPDIQRKLGGAAYVIAPQAPTMWMDAGLDRSDPNFMNTGKSKYSDALMACITEFIDSHPDIDRSRIYLGGCSNGGFMTMRMIIDHPDFFAAAYPVCEALWDNTISDEDIEKIKDIPIWFVHSANDGTVAPDRTILPTYKRLKAAGGKNIHATLFDRVIDQSGLFKDEQGRPYEYFGHFSWVHVYNDFCIYDMDGTRVFQDGMPVSLWQWMALQHK